MKNIRIPRAGRWSGGLLALASVWTLTACGGGNATETTTDSARSTSTPTVLSAQASPTGGEAGAAMTSADTQLAADLQKDSSGSVTTQPRNTEGRLLASNCFQCHGTNGTGGFESIRGGEAKEVMEFLTKPASKEIMAAHAQGYTTAQLQKIIAYLQQ
ncbi:c-type cytochrome [Hydrogenophaga sp. MI9]|uniref:c-type cytochrome n=1 Tax=Hydrogenophaga sp. MI9 TaxID=3453719 RepID=UPI003EEBE6C9